MNRHEQVHKRNTRLLGGNSNRCRRYGRWRNLCCSWPVSGVNQRRSTRSLFDCGYRCPRYILFVRTTLRHLSESRRNSRIPGSGVWPRPADGECKHLAVDKLHGHAIALCLCFRKLWRIILPPASQPFWKHILITGSVVGITGLNLLNARLIGKAEDWIVLLKLVILALFIGVGIWGVDSTKLAPSTWSSPLHLIAGGMIIFLAYEGFELIANTAQDVRDAPKTLPRAFYSSVGFVIVLYVLIAVVTVGTLPVDKIVAAKDYALAEAARPSLGQAGFILIAIAAMLSTASAINATVYGAARLSYVIAKDGELPSILERKTWGKPIEGLLITSGVTLLIANLADLSSMSTMGSAGFLLIFAAVNGANVVLADDTQSKRSLSLIGRRTLPWCIRVSDLADCNTVHPDSSGFCSQW